MTEGLHPPGTTMARQRVSPNYSRTHNYPRRAEDPEIGVPPAPGPAAVAAHKVHLIDGHADLADCTAADARDIKPAAWLDR